MDNHERLLLHIARQVASSNDLADTIPLYVRMYGPYLAKILYVSVCGEVSFLGFNPVSSGWPNDNHFHRVAPYFTSNSMGSLEPLGYRLEQLLRAQTDESLAYHGPVTSMCVRGISELLTGRGRNVSMKAWFMIVTTHTQARGLYVDEWSSSERNYGLSRWKSAVDAALLRFDERVPHMRGQPFPDREAFAEVAKSREWLPQ